VGLGLAGVMPPANAYEFERPLQRGSTGRDVRALELRVAGWYPAAVQRTLRVDRRFGGRTERALEAFQRHYGLAVDGIAGPQTFRKLDSLEDPDGSTRNFDWTELAQKRSETCGSRANSFAGSFRGGAVGSARVRSNVRSWMWRLEAIRAKAGDRPVTVLSAFRSQPYNRCIGGATLSQHLYGLAVDIDIAGIPPRRERQIARRSQVHGIACYAETAHNHLDLRIDNTSLPDYRHWWWPERDRRGRDRASDGRPCHGE